MPITYKTSWDYNGWKAFQTFECDESQNDWNQTLLTKINEVAKTFSPTSVISVSLNKTVYEKIIKTLLFFTSEKGVETIGNKYGISIDETIDDKIFIYEKTSENFGEITIENFKTNG
jgi:hypothetical protein